MIPAPGRSVTCPYGKKGDSWATGEHGGIDYGCPTGDPVYAMWDGTVTGNSWGSAYGTHIVIDHDKLPNGDPGLWAVYAHLSSKKVSAGARVEAGQLIGYSGATGNVSGPHLHVEVQRAAYWQSGNYVNPQPWIDAGGNGDEMSSIEYWYSGKPSGTLTVDDKYKRLDVEDWVPDADGLTIAMIYLNVNAQGGRADRIRVCCVRENGDKSAYQDFNVDEYAEYCITHVWFEKGEKGQDLHWEIRTVGGGTAVISTRYAKFTNIPLGL